MFKNQSGQKILLFAFTPADGLPKTGDAANLTAYVSKDFGTVTVLADTSATEMDATNAPGWYLFDLAQAESNFDEGLFTAKSSTSGVSVVGRPVTTVPNRFTTMVIDAAGLVDANAVKVGPTGAGTAQTAGDIIGDTNDIQARLPAALVSGRMDSSVGAMAADVITAAATAADFTTEIQSGLATAANLATVTGYIDTEVAAIKAKTDLIPASPAAVSDIPSAATVATAVAGKTLEGAYTLADLLRVVAAVLAGESTVVDGGGGTATVTFKSVDGLETRVTASMDASERTSVTLNPA